MRERKVRDAIESVFRRTHGRDMTAEERRLFGLTPKNNGNSQAEPITTNRLPRFRGDGRSRES
jgi:hypothetical protein